MYEAETEAHHLTTGKERNKTQEDHSHSPSLPSPESDHQSTVNTSAVSRTRSNDNLDIMSMSNTPQKTRSPTEPIAVNKVANLDCQSSSDTTTPTAPAEPLPNSVSTTSLSSSVSAPPTSTIIYDHVACPTCGKTITDPLTM
ncbi:hypothetical protein PLEOSDRAFT_1091776, partial [Pleurotus ostreatus PC15]